ncbi:MAG: group I intron-associated PD-(D/E)XK endonuclease [Planctomycetia bacterium]|nr:group I intron-associated PD-(D/E)XK endonuclease [Planctomycetia bacterium]
MRNTSLSGEVCRAQIIAALTLQGKTVLLPLGDFQRYDLVIDDGGRFLRVQCKVARLIKGAIQFHPCSIDSRSTPGRCVRKGYVGQVDFFGVYCPQVKKCYLVPIEIATATCCSLRVAPTKNGQQQGIRWAVDYEIRVDQVEVRGVEPLTS